MYHTLSDCLTKHNFMDHAVLLNARAHARIHTFSLSLFLSPVE
jgi:hypothetical protein